MSVSTVLLAFALMLILEGLLPFLAPAFWRKAFQQLLSLSNGQIRFIGLLSLLVGIALFYVLAP
ncbi:MAG: DUF2065 family protein [Zoogloeaceae bacterium]|jgi:uncharacterized protein YjeT (DUF2065 family)|nr:DUF2065 family protein [Zoogloeaceae bacterium]